ncbi:MAG: molybdenum cofactor guanylyltransferase [Bacteroidales bacterium]|nr:molybdenum cofactor guanylyltransferase [Bacteroidales bacterium]
MNKSRITGIILSGGKSRRMGAKKAFLNYRGKPLIEYSVDILERYCSEILISANEPGYDEYGYKVIEDKIKNIGPVGGILSTVEECHNDNFLVTACDIPEIDENLISDIAGALKQNDLVILIDKENKIHPLPFAGNKKIISELNKQIRSNNYKLHELLRSVLNNGSFKVETILIGAGLKNINTKEDLIQ